MDTKCIADLVTVLDMVCGDAPINNIWQKICNGVVKQIRNVSQIIVVNSVMDLLQVSMRECLLNNKASVRFAKLTNLKDKAKVFMLTTVTPLTKSEPFFAKRAI